MTDLEMKILAQWAKDCNVTVHHSPIDDEDDPTDWDTYEAVMNGNRVVGTYIINEDGRVEPL